MPDASYDAVVIGGGLNGLIAGLYLQEAGMETVILERNMEIGGGLCCDELPLPGFVANTCASSVRFYSTPCYVDFNLRDYGLIQIFPTAAQGMIFDDATCIVTYATHEVINDKTGETKRSAENVEKTLKEIARFSERDAETANDLIERFEKKWHSAMREWMYTPPPPWGVKDALEKLMDDPKYGVDPRWSVMTGVELANELFESIEMRCYFLRALTTSSGNWPDDVQGVFNLLHVLALLLSLTPPATVKGGTHTVAHSMQRAFVDRGGKFFVLSEVDKILVENDKATGVRLANGTEIQAKKCIVSDVDVNQTLLRFVGEDYFDHMLLRKIKNIRYDRMSGVFWGTLAVHELPEYKAASFNSDCNAMPRTLVGPKDPFYLGEKMKVECNMNGIPSRLCWFTGPDSIWDRSRVPEGKHLLLVEQYAGNASYFSDEKWFELRREFTDVLLKDWQNYASNMTRDNLIGSYFDVAPTIMARNIAYVNCCAMGCALVPSQIGRFRPIPELSGYRMPVKNLYLCSASTHVSGGVRGTNGYNCYKVIAEDFGLRKIWEEKGRPY